MDSSRIEQNKSGRDDKNKIEILDIFQHLNTKLPEGCLVNEGHIQIEFSDRSKKTHGFKKKNQLPKRDTKDTMTKDDLLEICHEVQKLSKHLYRGWRFTRIIISKDDHLYDVLGGLARMAKESKHSSGMDDQKGWPQKECLPDGWKVKSSKPATSTYNVSYLPSEKMSVLTEQSFSYKTEEELKKHIAETVYQEGNIDVDPYCAIIDTGCPKTVCGKPFIDAFIESRGAGEVIKRKFED